MKPWKVLIVTLSLLTTSLWTGVRASAQVFGGGSAPEVFCDGLVCGGNGTLGRDFVYEIHPNGNNLTSFEVSVEDGDIDNYVYAGPLNWSMSIVSAARSHDVRPTEHGTVTDKVGTCPYVLRFSGPARSQTFDVGFDYIQPNARFHDVQWKTSNNWQSVWTHSAGAGMGPVHSPLRLNVLLIVLDDVGTDKLELFDDPTHGALHPFAQVPNLNQLAANGVQFTNFYVNPVCSTSRACFQTGRYALRHGIGKFSHDAPLRDCEVTLGELLKEGFSPSVEPYHNGAFGKWHLTPGVHSNPTNLSHAIDNGYDHFSGTLGNVDDHFNWIKVEAEPPSTPSYSSVSGEWTADHVRADATEWIETAPEPFFAYVAFNPPHHPFVPPECLTDDERTLLSTGTCNAVESAGSGEFELFYRAMIEAVDSEIGYLLGDMDPAKLAKTMVIVVSDNGTPQGVVSDPHPHPLRSKGSIYQLGVRVPMIVSGPLASSGACDALVGAVDLFDTIAEITGADPSLVLPAYPCSSDRDSVSFLPLIEDPSGSTTRPAFSQQFEPNGPIEDEQSFNCLEVHARAVTNGAYKYIRRQIVPGNCDPCPNPLCYEEEFYDLIEDAEEGTNLFYPGIANDQDYGQAYIDLSSYMDLFEF